METTFKESYYANGKLWDKLQFLNGKQHGEQLYYHSNGKLNYKHQHLNGKNHGEQIGYYDNGELYYKNYYINDKYVSEKEWLEHKHKTKSLTDMYV
jgi:antitoxin component YwqK of YwqJK toxin-antitoxin module